MSKRNKILTIFTAIFFGGIAVSLSACDVEPDTSWEDIGAPLPRAEVSRKVYMNQMCLNSTTPFYSDYFKKFNVSLDGYCECASDWVVTQIKPEDDHEFALAYHEINYTDTEMAIQSNYSEAELRQHLATRMQGYATDYGLSVRSILGKAEAVNKVLAHCGNLDSHSK